MGNCFCCKYFELFGFWLDYSLQGSHATGYFFSVLALGFQILITHQIWQMVQWYSIWCHSIFLVRLFVWGTPGHFSITHTFRDSQQIVTKQSEEPQLDIIQGLVICCFNNNKLLTREKWLYCFWLFPIISQWIFPSWHGHLVT